MLKGLAFDRRAMQEAKTIVEARHSRPSLFMPTTGVIDGMDKFAEPMKDGCRGFRGAVTFVILIDTVFFLPFHRCCMITL